VLSLECGAEEGEGAPVCLILIGSKEVTGLSIWIHELGSCSGSFSLNVVQTEKEELNSVLRV